MNFSLFNILNKLIIASILDKDFPFFYSLKFLFSDFTEKLLKVTSFRLSLSELNFFVLSDFVIFRNKSLVLNDSIGLKSLNMHLNFGKLRYHCLIL